MSAVLLADDGVEYEERVRREREALLDLVHGVLADGLASPHVTEVIVNPDGSVWFDCLSGDMQAVGSMPAGRVKTIITSIAGMLGRSVVNGILEGEFPFDGSRVEAWLPPLSTGPSIVIRKHRKQGVDGWPALTLADYDLAPEYRTLIDQIIVERKTLLIVGATGSGKSTFGGAFLNRITDLCPHDRIVTIEDTFELYCKAKNWLPLHSTPEVSQRDLHKTAMRARPDRLITGETRDQVAIDMIMAMTTGHSGFTTVHGNSCAHGLTRVLQCTRLDGKQTVSAEMVCDAIDYVMLMKRRRNPLPGENSRYLADIQKAVAWRDSRFVLEPITHTMKGPL